MTSQSLAAMCETERKLRLLPCVQIAGALGYYDDGEAQDSRCHPTIDFMRDTPEEIQAKLNKRAQLNLEAGN